ncbi:MAG: S1C family serine protease [SAR324 cluster bacterium]
MGNAAQALSAALASAAKKAGTSLVRVDAGSRWGATGSVWSGEAIVTASHVLRDERSIQVLLPDGSAVAAMLAGRDESTDVAVLRVEPGVIEAGGGHVPEWIGLEDAAVGTLVLAVARPGRTVRVALGVIGALGEGWPTALGGTVERYVEPDISARAGFSGGLLVNASGQALGMNTAPGRHAPLLTLPSVTLRGIVPDLLIRGRVPRPYLGIGAYPVRVAAGGPAAGQAALIVVSVEPTGPAAHAGMLQGDLLLTLDGQATASLGALKNLLEAGSAGRTVRLGLLRAGQTRELEVALGTA